MKKIVSPITGKSKYLLIENCEFVSDVKISNDLKESLKLSNGKAGTLIVKNLPGTILNRENQNGRIYSTAVLAQAIREAKPLFETKQLLSQACEHPEGSFVSPTTASHVVTNAYIKKNVNVVVDGEQGQYDMLFMDIEVLNTDEGRNLRALLEAECSVGTSIRGVGDMEGKYVKNYEFLGIDFVGNPSSSTFTRMPVSESAKVEMKDPREMKETFNVTTSSTNVVRDLDQAAMLQQQLDGLGYGTVTKTSTKLDQETDPKTGAQTSIATLEAETSDDVADLDQALQMARNAMLNGTINVDSITIENIPEEGETKEAVEACEYVPEKTTLKEKPVTEAKKEDDEDPNLGKKFVLKAGNRGFVTFDKNAIDFTNKPEDALHFTQGKEENGMVSLSKVTEILDAMGEFDVQKYFQTNNINLGGDEKQEGLVGDINLSTGDIDVGVGGVGSIAKDEGDGEPKQEGTAGAIAGGIVGTAMGLVTGSPIGGYKMGKSIGSDVQDGKFPPATESTMTEENGSNTKYMAQVTINDQNGSNNETISVSSVDLDSAKNEIANLYDMKVKSLKGQGDVNVILVDTTTGEQLHYNPESQLLEASCKKEFLDLNIGNTENDVDAGGIANDVEVDTDSNEETTNNVEVEEAAEGICARCEGEFEDSELIDLQGAKYCKSCYQKVTGDAPFAEEYNEADFEDPVVCSWCKDMYEKSDCKKEKDLGWLCDQCQRALESRGVELEFDDTIEEGGDQNIQVNGNKVVTKVDDNTTIEKDFDSPIQAQVATAAVAKGKADPKVLVPEDTQTEKLYSNPSEPSDGYEKEPLEDAITEDFIVTLGNIDWNIDNVDPRFFSKIENLPDTCDIRVQSTTIDTADSPEELKAAILAGANETMYPFGINDGTVVSIKDTKTGEVLA